ncbi:glutathione S-transferase [Brevundimonas naejangsanensis]|uniref:Glutathione S-transferase n=1 Tax=Brevundimonas naejangsanensis TaxID=588932 RepID=A0A494RC72_9CAUL|nr:glutathione S-transferase [Brevundimonas naejangsanensis]AYG93917.1 glutathione S-transferase [Brevundimonas naejangsanensis]
MPYALYYWSAPFRGQFVRAVLAFAGEDWAEPGDGAIAALMAGAPEDMPIPFMGPPVLVDAAADVAISQMPAIVFYLGETLGLLPSTPALRALTIKVVNDANDVIDEITLDGGRQMWTEQRWTAFAPRLRRWMALWEEQGRRHGLRARSGFLLGGDAPGIADVVTATLWSTLSERFPKIGAMLEDTAPLTANLVRRVSAVPALADLAARAWRDYGETYCGGRIEISLRRVAGSDVANDRDQAAPEGS